MLATFLIGLREGLEASLLVSILVAYLVRTGRRDHLPSIWAGVAGAVALSLGFGALLTFTSARMTFQAQETFGGVMSIIAVGFVTWMIFWMRRTARSIKGELQGKIDRAVTMGATALIVTAFLAVAREGLETALFLWSAVGSQTSGTPPIVGAALGLAVAAALGYLIYRGAVKINLAKFFTWTGAGLVVVAAGVLAYGVHDLQEGGVLPGLNALAFDVSAVISTSSVLGTLLKGIFNFSPQTTWLQAIAWIGYVVPVMVLFLRPVRSRPTSSAKPAPEPERTLTAQP